MTTQFGRYELIEKLAAGGMGEVWLARQRTAQGLGKRVVLKLVLPHLIEKPEIGVMFLDEARVALGLSHANVAQVFDAGEVNGTAYLAMEFVHGVDLRQVLERLAERGERLPPGLAVRIVADAAAGLAYAHDARDEAGRPLNLVHRDVSPHNVLVSFDGAVKVIDFGIARTSANRSLTATGMVKGKYGYVAPEQARSQPLDRRTDVFALGIVLYESLSGASLFQRDSEISTLNAVLEAKVPPLVPATPGMDEELQAIVFRALEQDPAKRFASAGELRLALEDWLIARRTPASTAHLAGWMRKLFADKLDDPFLRAAPASVAPPSPASPRTDFDNDQPDWQPAGPALSLDGNLDAPLPASSQSSAPEPGRREPAAPPRPVAPRDEVLELDSEKLAHATAREFMAESAEEKSYREEAKPRRRRFVPFVLALLVLFAAGGVAFTLLQGSKDPVGELATAASKVASAETVEQLPRALADAVKGEPALLSVDSQPSGAEVWLGNEQLGTTPFVGQNDYPEGEYRLRLVKPGYKNAEVEFTAGRPAKLVVKLTKR